MPDQGIKAIAKIRFCLVSALQLTVCVTKLMHRAEKCLPITHPLIARSCGQESLNIPSIDLYKTI